MAKKQTWNIGYWAIALLLLLLPDAWQSATQVEPVPYSEFEKALADGRIADVTVFDRKIAGRLKAADGRKTTLVATRVEPDLAARLEKYNVPYTRVVDNTFLRDLLSWVVPALVFFGLWFFLFRRFADKQGMGGLMSIGKSCAKVYIQTDTGVTFADVAGVDEARHELEEVVDFLKHPQAYRWMAAHIPKGVLLVGPPGNGKALLGHRLRVPDVRGIMNLPRSFATASRWSRHIQKSACHSPLLKSSLTRLGDSLCEATVSNSASGCRPRRSATSIVQAVEATARKYKWSLSATWIVVRLGASSWKCTNFFTKHEK